MIPKIVPNPLGSEPTAYIRPGDMRDYARTVPAGEIFDDMVSSLEVSKDSSCPKIPGYALLFC